MMEVVMWSLIAFFGAFGIVEFVRLVYTDIFFGSSNYHVVVSTRNNEENIESVIRSAIMSANSGSYFVINDNASEETKTVLEKLKNTYSYIKIVTYDEYADFLKSKEC